MYGLVFDKSGQFVYPLWRWYSCRGYISEEGIALCPGAAYSEVMEFLFVAFVDFWYGGFGGARY
jgi:hypothetical protein